MYISVFQFFNVFTTPDGDGGSGCNDTFVLASFANVTRVVSPLTLAHYNYNTEKVLSTANSVVKC